MGQLLELVTPVHRATKRDCLARMVDDKVGCMLKAKEYEFDYWDGDRRHGYGGYQYMPDRWKPVACALIDTYGLKPGGRVLDVGCGKGFLLYEMQRLMPELHLTGIDISQHGLRERHPAFRGELMLHRAEDPYPFDQHEFDLVISLGTLHNLRLPQLKSALQEIERAGRQKYVMVESYRNEQEMFNLQCWALTAETLLGTEAWIWLYQQFGYTGDYEFIYF